MCERDHRGGRRYSEPVGADQRTLDSLPYDAFEQNPDGSWQPVRRMVIELEGTGRISVGPWMVFKRGRKLMGHDIARWLDEMSEGWIERAA